MRRFSKFAALFTAIAIAFTGCNAPNESAPELSAAPTRTVEAVSVEETAERVTAAAETEERAETEVKAETTEAAPTEEADGKPEFMTYTEPDVGHVFVDFEYIEDAEGITDPKLAGDYLNKALEALKETEEYNAFEEYVRSEEFDKESFAEFVGENGEPVTRFERAYIEKFDNDRNEAFIFITILRKTGIPDIELWEPRTFLIFAEHDGAEVLDSYHEIYEYELLNYGACVQLMLCSKGLIGNDRSSVIFGVVDGNPVKLYELRGGYRKVDCFLSAYSSHGASDFMYYDTAAHEYRAIKGRELDVREVLAMDTTGSLDVYKDKYPAVTLIGGKYYCFNSGYLIVSKPNVFNNGRFTECDNGVVMSTGEIYDIDFVEDIDYDAAVASMLTPAQAALL